MNKLTPLKPVPTLIAVAITLIIWFLIPVPEGVQWFWIGSHAEYDRLINS